MKTWQKIFVCTLALVMLLLTVSTALLVSNNHSMVVGQNRETAANEHTYMITNLKNRLLYERVRNNTMVLTDTHVAQAFDDVFNDNSAFSDLHIMLYRGEDTIASYQPLSFEKEGEILSRMETVNEYGTEILKIGEHRYVMVASNVSLEMRSYVLMTFHDVNETYAVFDKQLSFATALSGICAVLVAVILLVLVLVLLRPLQKLNEGIGEIAKGNYQKKIQLRGNNEITELADNINAMSSAIEKNVSALQNEVENRRIFIANLAHEMKTPLTSILGFADILRIKTNLTPQEKKEYVGIILEETKRLRSLSGKLMELITLGSTQMDWQKVSLMQTVEDLRTVFYPIMQQHKLKMTCTVQDHILVADVELLKSMLYNIVDNAVKASSPGGTVAITVKKKQGRTEIRVRDEGIGIAPEDVKRIMEPFYMVDKSRTRAAGGAGLGLALCQEIAKLHRGNITIQSKLGMGTTVCISLQGGV